MTNKRKRGQVEVGEDLADDGDGNQCHEEILETPTKRRRGRPPGSTNKTTSRKIGYANGTVSRSPAPEPKGKPLVANRLSTPKGKGKATPQKTTPLRTPSQRALEGKKFFTPPKAKGFGDEHAPVASEDSEEEMEEGVSEGEDAEPDDDPPAASSQPTTPSKRQRKTSRRKAKSPTLPSNLPPHEQYFFQTQAKNAKTSNNTLSSLNLLSHSEYHDIVSLREDTHASSIQFLHKIHNRSFPQWRFELSQDFSICLYGYGSKRQLITDFAKYLHAYPLSPQPPKIVIVNGFSPTITLRKILITLASAIHETPASSLPMRIGTQHRETIASLVSYLDSHPPGSSIYLFIHSLDAVPLRRHPVPPLLAQLASSPHISLLATCDTPNFPLLWDNTILERYNFVFHDATTFVSYCDGGEISSVIDDVNELLGRSGRTVKGKEGVGFVLRSLPENARNLYRVLVAEILTAMAEGEDGDAGEAGLGGEEDEEGEERMATSRKGSAGDIGVDYRILYQKAVDDFICSSEMAFRTLLKEFHDHQMVVSKRNGLGGEMLSVPFRREEMETILEDLIA